MPNNSTVIPKNGNHFQIIPFKYHNHKIRVVRDEQGEPWWVAKDVCEILEHSDTSMAVKGLDEDEKLIQTFLVSGQKREMLTINESGLYALILRSNKPQAKPFRRWITSEVIPSIRKTGQYSIAGSEVFTMPTKSTSRSLPNSQSFNAEELRTIRSALFITSSLGSVSQALLERGDSPEALTKLAEKIDLQGGAAIEPERKKQKSGDIMSFKYEQYDIRVTQDEQGDFWWAAWDVCKILERSNYKIALKSLNDDEKGVRKVCAPGGYQTEMDVINESGLYTLILRSNKPQAEPFRKWITSEALPALHKMGQCPTKEKFISSEPRQPTTPPLFPEIPDKLIELAREAGPEYIGALLRKVGLVPDEQHATA